MQLFGRMRDAAAGVPGVASAAVSTIAPMSGMGWNRQFDVPGRPALAAHERWVWVNAITPGWFATYGTRLIAGRDFDTHDTAGTRPVAIVNEAFARKFFGVPRPVGRVLQTGGDRGEPRISIEIVGVAQTAVYAQPRAGAQPTVYLPLTQVAGEAPPFGTVALRSRGPSALSLMNSATAAIGAIRPDVSIHVHPLASFIDAALVRERVLAMISGFFGGLRC